MLNTKNGARINFNALEFLLGGNCFTTLESLKTNKHYTYAITARKNEHGKVIVSDNMTYFIKVAMDYMEFVYAGYMKVDFKNKTVTYYQGEKGQLDATTPVIKGLLWVLNHLLHDRDIKDVEVYHLGVCGVCGKPLTDPISLYHGLGPTCRKKIEKRQYKALKKRAG